MEIQNEKAYVRGENEQMLPSKNTTARTMYSHGKLACHSNSDLHLSVGAAHFHLRFLHQLLPYFNPRP